MDLREKKTKRSIAKAFLQLRRQKRLEKITVKELAELAEISKATFYLHYRDIFDLSETIQEEVVQNIIAEISQPENFLADQTAFTYALCHSFYARQEQIDVLFSGTQAGVLPIRIEKELRQYLRKLLPEGDRRMDMLLTYQILGSYFVSQEYHKEYGMDEVIQFISQVSQAATSACLKREG